MTSRHQQKFIIWLLLIVAVLTILSLFFLTVFGFGQFTEDNYIQVPVTSKIFQTQQFLNSPSENLSALKNQISSLKARIAKLETLLKEERRKTNFSSASTVNNFDCSAHIRKQVGSAEIFHGHRFNNEFELIPFDHFTFNRIFPIHLGLAKRVAERPIGRKREDLLAAIRKALESLNKNLNKKENYDTQESNYTYNDFLEGIYRTDPKTGTEYELYFQKQTNDPVWKEVKKVLVMHPFAPLQTVVMNTIPNPALLARRNKNFQNVIVHIVLPLSGRIAQLSLFIKNFLEILKTKDDLINLTVVYLGNDGLQEATKLLKAAASSLKEKSSKIQLIQSNHTFSRAKGLQMGAEHCVNLHKTNNNTNALLFMCDVDIIFNERFLNRCRWNTEPGKKVYYPAVFSLYNPQVVYTLQGKKIPSETERMQITKENGFWRDFGFGMTCQYRSDFLELGGFDKEIIGWGGEDEMLYRKYVRSNLKIIRATDPGIFHMWHPKDCVGQNELQLSLSQYLSCIRSRALNEASHAQLGFLAFRDEIAEKTNNFTMMHLKKEISVY